jgi:YD repeat-containing protein
VTDAAGTITYSYDNRLRKTQEQRTVTSVTKTTQFTYDALDRLVATTYPDTEVLTTAFNTQGEANSLTAAAPLLTNIDYNALGKITKKEFGNGLATNYTYNTDDCRLQKIKTGTLQELSYRMIRSAISARLRMRSLGKPRASPMTIWIG